MHDFLISTSPEFSPVWRGYYHDLIKKWGIKGVPFNFTLNEKICAILSSYKFEDDKARLSLLSLYGEQALLNPDAVPVAIEVSLVTYLAQTSSIAKSKSADEWTIWRANRTKMWLHAMQRIGKGIDKKYIPGSPNTIPHMSIVPPGG